MTDEVEEELSELKAKVGRLEAFNDSLKFRNMSNEQQILLVVQLRTMHTYVHILRLRMKYTNE